MITRTSNTSDKNENKAIHEILLKILEKWRSGFLPDETDSEEMYKIAADVDLEKADPLNEEIITETILLRPEDFQKRSSSKKTQDKMNPETGNEVPLEAHEVLNSNKNKMTGEYVPETVIIDSKNIVKANGDSGSNIHKEEIPETVIFSTRETRDSYVASDQSAHLKGENDKQKQGSSKTVEHIAHDKKTENQEDMNFEIPETKIFRGRKDNNE